MKTIWKLLVETMQKCLDNYFESSKDVLRSYYIMGVLNGTFTLGREVPSKNN